jgi:head-tail adaptor
MAYSSGMLSKRITIAKRKSDTQETFGKSGQPKYEILGTFNANETFNKGTKSLREGALDAYDTVMFRMRYNSQVDRWCLLKYHNKWYQITSFNEDFHDNQIQITAVEMANQSVNIVEPYNPSASAISGGSSQSHEVG